MTVVNGQYEWDDEKNTTDFIMTTERINELKNRPIDLSDIPEVTKEQFAEFYPRQLRRNFMQFLSFLDKENIDWISSYGNEYKTTINEALTKVRLSVNTR